MTTHIGKKHTDFPFVIASTNVFLKDKPRNAYIPAEVGFARFSFYQGIINTFHSFIPPQDISNGNVVCALKTVNGFIYFPL